MKLIDLLLVIAAAGLIAAGFLIHPALGCVAVTVSAATGWVLLSEPAARKSK